MDIPTSPMPPASAPDSQFHQTPAPVMPPVHHSSGMHKAVIALVAVAVLVGGYTALAKWQSLWPFETPTLTASPTVSPTASPTTSATTDPTTGWKTYENKTAGYTYKYPPEWNATTNQYVATHSLFGPGATTTTSSGGVDFNSNYSASVESYLANFDVSERKNVTVDGLSAVRVRYTSIAGATVSVVLKKDAQLINIYLHSRSEVEIALFDQLAATFKFTTKQPAPLTQQQLNTLFEVSKKSAGTKVFYSENLGVGFTYLDPKGQLGVSEEGSKIALHAAGQKPSYNWQSIEVFDKDPALTFEQAIKVRFLTGYDPKNCFVKMYDGDPALPNYMKAGISFPPTTDPNAPWWQNGDKCPAGYTETNAGLWFQYNKDVSSKFIFVKLGQDSLASDGTPPTADGGRDWTQSIRIVR